MVEKHPLEKLVPDPEESAVGSILISPDQETLRQAMLADFIDAIPLGGDALLLVRGDIAEREGLDFPEDQAYIQNVISDLPPPGDYLLNALSAPNSVNYVEQNDPVEIIEGIEMQVFEGENTGIKFVVPAVVDTPFGLPNPRDHLPV